jgi:hypothetical protein
MAAKDHMKFINKIKGLTFEAFPPNDFPIPASEKRFRYEWKFEIDVPLNKAQMEREIYRQLEKFKVETKLHEAIEITTRGDENITRIFCSIKTDEAIGNVSGENNYGTIWTRHLTVLILKTLARLESLNDEVMSANTNGKTVAEVAFQNMKKAR